MMGSALADTCLVFADERREDMKDLRDSFALNLRPLTGVRPPLLSLYGDGDRLECLRGVWLCRLKNILEATDLPPFLPDAEARALSADPGVGGGVGAPNA